MPEQLFNYIYRVYHDDVDFLGVMNNAQYLKYFEHARSDWLRAAGGDQKQLLQEGIGFVVRSATIEYISPARYDDEIRIGLTLTAKKHVSMHFKQYMFRAIDNHLLATAEVKVACVDRNLKPCIIPELRLNPEMCCGRSRDQLPQRQEKNKVNEMVVENIL